MVVFDKKCLAVRIASYLGQEGRFAEHMLALCIRPFFQAIGNAV